MSTKLDFDTLVLLKLVPCFRIDEEYEIACDMKFTEVYACQKLSKQTLV